MSGPKSYEEWEKMIAPKPSRKTQRGRRPGPKAEAATSKSEEDKEKKEKKEGEKVEDDQKKKDAESYNNMVATSRMTDDELAESLMAFADQRDAEKAREAEKARDEKH